MTRVLSGAALIALAIAVVWSNQRIVFESVAFLLLFAATYELITLFRAGGVDVPRWPAMIASLLTLATFSGILNANLAFPDDGCRADGRADWARARRDAHVARGADALTTISGVAVSVAVPGVADWRDDRHSRAGAGAALPADADRDRQRHGAVLHRAADRPASAGAGDQPQEDH